MSITTAITELHSRLAAAGLVVVPDRRVESFADSPASAADGRYILTIIGVGEPWPEIATRPRAWIARATLQISSLAAQSSDTAAISTATRAHAAVVALAYAPTPANVQVWDLDTAPSIETLPGSQIRVWTWEFRIRYEE
jgi:hypothetical protein